MIPGMCGNEVVSPGELGHFGVFEFAFRMCVNALWKEHGAQLLIDFKVIYQLLGFSSIHSAIYFSKGKADVVSSYKWTVQTLMIHCVHFLNNWCSCGLTFLGDSC